MCLLSKSVAKHGIVVPFHAVWIGKLIRTLVVGVGLAHLVGLLLLLGFVPGSHNGIKTVHHRIEEYANAKHIAQARLLAPELTINVAVGFNILNTARFCTSLLRRAPLKMQALLHIFTEAPCVVNATKAKVGKEVPLC